MLGYFTPCWHDDELTWCVWKGWSRPKGKCCPESAEMEGTHGRGDSLMCKRYDRERGQFGSRQQGHGRRSFLSWFLRDRKVQGGRDSINPHPNPSANGRVSIQNKLSFHPKGPAASDGVCMNIRVWEAALETGHRLRRNRLCSTNL